MKISLCTDNVAQLSVGLVGIGCFEDQFREAAAFQAFDRGLDGLLGRLATDEKFTGKAGQTLQCHTHGRVQPERVLLVGLGSRKDFRDADLRDLGARVAKVASQVQTAKAAVVLPPLEKATEKETARAAQFTAEGARLGLYKFAKYLTGDSKRAESLDELHIACAEARTVSSATQEGLARAEQVAAGIALARDLVNEPASELTPRRMAEVAERIAKEHGLEVKVLGPRECEKLGMGMYLGVARGSDEEPRFIHLTYRPRGKATKKVALVGKGVTFDSGGLSLKPSAAMEDMKIDMAGAATVLAAIGVLAEQAVPVEVHAFAACTENMLSAKSYKLGDVLTSMNGKTVEINNTDAEGRLTLGDALTYAIREVQPDEIFDFATLTGACLVALGPYTAGVMSNNPELVERWLTAARAAGEEMWHLPLPEKLREQLKSDIADMRNTGERYGGALTAGLFLKEFVGETPWVHVDLAGPAALSKEMGHIAKGGTGFGVATIIEYLSHGG